MRDLRVKGPDDVGSARNSRLVETRHDLDTLHRAVNDIRAAKAEVASLHKKLDGKQGNAALLAEGDALAAKVEPIEGTLMQVKLKVAPKAISTTPDMLNEQIYAFAGGLEDADTSLTK